MIINKNTTNKVLFIAVALMAMNIPATSHANDDLIFSLSTGGLGSVLTPDSIIPLQLDNQIVCKDDLHDKKQQELEEAVRKTQEALDDAERSLARHQGSLDKATKENARLMVEIMLEVANKPDPSYLDYDRLLERHKQRLQELRDAFNASTEDLSAAWNSIFGTKDLINKLKDDLKAANQKLAEYIEECAKKKKSKPATTQQ